MRPTDDTSITGQILGSAAKAVGATKAAAFDVHREGKDTYALGLRLYRAFDGSDPVSAQQMAEGLRRFVMPALVEGRDKVIEVPELAGLGARQFVLVVLIRDAVDVRLVGALLVTCQYPWQAEQRLKVLQDLSAESKPEAVDNPEGGEGGGGYRGQPGS
jgi:hypothetical protein